LVLGFDDLVTDGTVSGILLYCALASGIDEQKTSYKAKGKH
jgi:hypothetical protein